MTGIRWICWPIIRPSEIVWSAKIAEIQEEIDEMYEEGYDVYYDDW